MSKRVLLKPFARAPQSASGSPLTISVKGETMYELSIEAPKLAVIRTDGEVSEEDYERVVPRLEELIREHGKVRLLLDVTQFKDATPGALWEDLKFDAEHLNDFEKIAVVGDESWEDAAAELASPLTNAEVKTFGPKREDQARTWARS